MNFTLTDIGTILLALATTISLLYISRQVSMTRRQAKGQFLLALDEQFETTNNITLRLINEPNFKPSGTEWIEIWRLMSVFERINVMVEDGILDVGLVDRLHGFRLISILANDDIYERLASTGAEWQDFIDLCYAVADHQRHSVVDARRTQFRERVRKLNKQTRVLKNPWRIPT